MSPPPFLESNSILRGDWDVSDAFSEASSDSFRETGSTRATWPVRHWVVRSLFKYAVRVPRSAPCGLSSLVDSRLPDMRSTSNTRR